MAKSDPELRRMEERVAERMSRGKRKPKFKPFKKKGR
jgi:hypothetical protein